MKIFGVGYKRSGSRSLAEALNLLGFKTVHWEMPDGYKLPDVIGYNGLRGRELFEGYDDIIGYVDYPIYKIYPKLAKLFPDAKFISTYRDAHEIAESWQRKMKRHNWQPGTIDEYGIRRDHFHRCVVEAAVHYSDLKQYFRGNPNFMQFSVTEGWEPLCTFLNVPVPDVSFPWVKH